MDKKNIVQQEANMRVVEVFGLFPEQVSSVPLLQSKSTLFIELTDEIAKLTYEVSLIAERPAYNRQEIRAKLEKACFETGNNIQLYARTISDIDIVEKTHSSISTIRHLKYYELLMYAKFLVEYSNDHAEDLLNVGYSETQRTTLNESFTNYEAHYEEPQDRINQRKVLNERITELTRTTAAELKTVFDPIVNNFSPTDPFAEAYRTARIVRDPATRHQQEEAPEASTE